jgi:hypothetical protein
MLDAGFVSCWLDIGEAQQQELVRSLEAALASPSIPPEIVTALLNLAEFMEHDERPLPLDTRTLGALAEKCHAFAKVFSHLTSLSDPHPSRLRHAVNMLIATARNTSSGKHTFVSFPLLKHCR